MKKHGLQKAHDDLNAAKKALLALNNATSSGSATEAWSAFVEKFGRFFNKLAASAKGNASDEGWISQILRQRNSDEMLSYLLQCRNAVEHGVEDIAVERRGGIVISGGPFSIGNVRIDSDDFSGIRGGPNLKIDRLPSTLRLLDVTNRSVNYPVPTSHFGNLIDATPAVIAELGIRYAEFLLSEAQTRG